MRKILGAVVVVAAVAAVSFGAMPRARAQSTLRIASLAPEGSSWMKLFHEWAQAIEKAPGVTLKIKFFPGGISGDERDVVRKMRLGSLDGAAVTAIGLGLIQPEVRVLEIPFLIKTEAELDHVRTTLDAEFHKKFEEKGYVLLFWGDVGPVHLFSNNELTSKAALGQMKIWAWTDDPLVRGLFEQLKLSGVPLGVPDVLTSLQTGLINACYGSPLSTLALQWNTKVKFMTSMTISQSIGATVITKKSWDAIPAATQKIIAEQSQKLGQRLLKQIREDNKKALAKMESLGLKVVSTPGEVVDQFQSEAQKLAPKLDNSVYTTAWRNTVEKLLADFRAGKK